MQELYTTEFLLKRLYEKLEDDKLNKKKFSLKEKPEIILQNRKTFIKNFIKICELINREPLHFQLFIDNELQVSSSINEENMLMLNNTYSKPQVEKVMNKYIMDYVICSEPKCLSGDTVLIRNNRISFLECKSCQSKKSVNDIKKTKKL